MAETENPPTLEQVRESLRRTEEDCKRLEIIIGNLSLFIYDTDEDRSDMVPALGKFQGLLDYCAMLRAKIRLFCDQMEKGQN